MSVTNNMGDKAILPISVEFYADSYEERLFHPNIYLKQYILYLEKGSSFQPKDYLDYLRLEISSTSLMRIFRQRNP